MGIIKKCSIIAYIISILFIICILIFMMLILSSCGHNYLQYSDAIGFEAGFIPEQYKFVLNVRYGKLLSAAVKDRSEVVFENSTIVSGDEKYFNTSAGTDVYTKLSVKTGEQITGYAVDLVKAKSESFKNKEIENVK